MRTFILATILSLMLFSLCLAEDTTVKRAYSLYYQGKTQQAIQLLEDYVRERPDPHALYFLGYAYYEKKKMDTAMRYFNDAYLIDPFYSPIAKEGD